MLKKQNVSVTKKKSSLSSKIFILCLLTCLIPFFALASSKKDVGSIEASVEASVEAAIQNEIKLLADGSDSLDLDAHIKLIETAYEKFGQAGFAIIENVVQLNEYLHPFALEEADKFGVDKKIEIMNLLLSHEKNRDGILPIRPLVYIDVLELDVKQALPFIKQASHEKDETYFKEATKKWTTDEALYVLDEVLKVDSLEMKLLIKHSGLIPGIVEQTAPKRFGEIVSFLESKLKASDVSSKLKEAILHSVLDWHSRSKSKSKSKLLASPKILEEALLSQDSAVEGMAARIIAKLEVTQALVIIKQSIERTPAREFPKNTYDDDSRFRYVFHLLFRENSSTSAVLQGVVMLEELIDHKKPEVRGQTVFLANQLKGEFDFFYEGKVIFEYKEVAVIESSLQSIILKGLNDKNASVKKLAEFAAIDFAKSGSKFSAKEFLSNGKTCKGAFAAK